MHVTGNFGVNILSPGKNKKREVKMTPNWVYDSMIVILSFGLVFHAFAPSPFSLAPNACA